jgi:sensor histidine kinase YesM
VPALLVQPFLENAINHGIGPSDRTDLKICMQVKLINNKIHYIIQDNGIGRDQSRVYNQLNKPFHKSVGMKLTQDRINIFNQDTGESSRVKITDLFDEENKPAGTRIEFAIKSVSYASPQGHPGR